MLVLACLLHLEFIEYCGIGGVEYFLSHMLGICIYTIMLGLKGHNIDCIYIDKWALCGHF